jgi:hypothetical protein
VTRGDYLVRCLRTSLAQHRQHKVSEEGDTDSYYIMVQMRHQTRAFGHDHICMTCGVFLCLMDNLEDTHEQHHSILL